jgi:SAM-dependent methyltransferase
MEENFRLYSQYYDLLYLDKNYNAEAAYVVELIKNHMPTAKSLLELGSGTGKHAKIFAAAGYHVLGIERSSDMVAIAQKDKTENLSYQIADIIDFQTDQKFDVALSLFHVISYITDNNSLIKTFDQTNQHLNVGGLFIFDVWHSSAVNHQKPEEREKVWKDQKIQVTRKAKPIIYTETNIVNVNYDITIEDLSTHQIDSFKEDHQMRHFCKPEIELLAYATGFELLLTEEWLTKKNPSVDTWGVTYILRKI